MDGRHQKMAAALAILVVIVLLILWNYSAPKEKFCGGVPDPAAASEALGLYELGVRASEGFTAGCGNVPSPAATAEAGGLMQMGWRPEHLRSRPLCEPPHPAAIATATALQSAKGLHPGAPYYTKGGFTTGGGSLRASDLDMVDLRSSLDASATAAAAAYDMNMVKAIQEAGGDAEAAGEINLLSALQAIPDDMNVDEFAARQMGRDQSAYGKKKAYQQKVRADNPAQTPARHARLNSMREGFGGPPVPGLGWEPTRSDFAASPESLGWGDAQSMAAAQCNNNCLDGCVGTHCREICKDSCRTRSLIDASGIY